MHGLILAQGQMRNQGNHASRKQIIKTPNNDVVEDFYSVFTHKGDKK